MLLSIISVFMSSERTAAQISSFADARKKRHAKRSPPEP